MEVRIDTICFVVLSVNVNPLKQVNSVAVYVEAAFIVLREVSKKNLLAHLPAGKKRKQRRKRQTDVTEWTDEMQIWNTEMNLLQQIMQRNNLIESQRDWWDMGL